MASRFWMYWLIVIPSGILMLVGNVLMAIAYGLGGLILFQVIGGSVLSILKYFVFNYYYVRLRSKKELLRLQKMRRRMREYEE